MFRQKWVKKVKRFIKLIELFTLNFKLRAYTHTSCSKEAAELSNFNRDVIYSQWQAKTENVKSANYLGVKTDFTKKVEQEKQESFHFLNFKTLLTLSAFNKFQVSIKVTKCILLSGNPRPNIFMKLLTFYRALWLTLFFVLFCLITLV